jgi:hypothetical protein
MANKFVSFLEKIGHGFLTGVHIGEDVAIVAEPFVDIVFPAIAPLYNGTVATITNAQAKAQAAIQPGNTQIQNFVSVTAALTPILESYAAAAGLPKPTADKISAYAEALLASLKLL